MEIRMTRLQCVTAISGLCISLVACGDPSAGPTESGTLAPTPPTPAAGSGLTFNGTWKKYPSLVPARWRSAADLLGKSIIVVGGLNGANESIRRVDAYNVETRTWTGLKPLPIPLYDALGATAIHGKLYVAGGKSTTEDCLKTLYVYDPLTNSWARKADMPLTGCHGVQANILGQLYVYTVYTGPGRGDLFAAYNPNTNTWVRRPVPEGSFQSYPVGEAINDKFYLTGGIDASGQFNHVLQVYDPATKIWTKKSPLPTGRDNAFATAFHGKLFVAGGTLDDNGLAVATDVVEAYDPLTDTWATGPSMLAPRRHGAAAWGRGNLFFTIDGLTDGTIDSRVEALSTAY
jgi:N-acetylneuraminic acid mutarotase